jgi:predicted Fe-S protein YdhL (DUF1289 family)
MKTLQIILLLNWIIITSCSATHAIYGVPEDQWHRLSDKEQQAMIERVKRQEQINAQTRAQADKAREAAEEFANYCHQEKEDMSAPDNCKVTTKRQWGL